MSDAVLVYGAYGHTGRFVLAELQRRGWDAIAAGRDRDALGRLAPTGAAPRCFTVDDSAAVAAAAVDARAILNCAGPFDATAGPLIEAALRAGIPYLDVTGEPDVTARAFERFGSTAVERGVVVMPAAGFFGAVGDLLVPVALGGWDRADRITVSYALDEWKATAGTRAAAQRMAGGRLVFQHGQLTVRTTPPPLVERVFPAPVGPRSTIGEYPSPESVLIPRHVATHAVAIFMTVEAIRDLRDPEATAPTAGDDHVRSEQRFMVHAEAERDGQTRHASATGTDIYATTAPILVECMERVLHADGGPGGVLTPGELFDARDVLEHLAPWLTMHPPR